MSAARAFALAIGFFLVGDAFAAPDDEVAKLLERAQFWQARSRDDLARDEVEKALRLAPDHPDALVLRARMQLRANQDREAATTFERLRASHPQHPGVGQISAALRIRGPDRDRLRQARQLARAGRNDEALAAYRAIFPDGFPDDEIALEFAQVLAGSRDGWEPGRAQLTELSRRHPDDARYQVAIASHLSTRKPVAPSVFAALRELANHPSVAVSRQAREAWRRAVLAMDPVEETLPALRDYVAANPGETAVTERLEEVRRIAAEDNRRRTDPGLRAKREGWDALEAGRTDEADARLQEAMRRYPKDGDNVGGLGLVRLRQGRHAEAQELFERAARLDAASRGKWEGLARTARFWRLLAQAREARDAGTLDRAEALVREARSLDPNEPAAGSLLEELRGSRLREEGRRLVAQGHGAEAIAPLEQAVALDPDDPWTRHDLARLYAARGEPQRGEALFDDLLKRRPAEADARYANALFLASIGRESQALRVLEAIPPANRSGGMTSLQRRLWVAVQAQRARAFAAAGRAAEAERVLAAMQPAIGSDVGVALEVARVLRQLDRDVELSALLDRVEAMGTKSPEQSAEIAGMRLAISLRRIDVLLENGDYGTALPLAESVMRSNPAREGEGWRYRRIAELLDRRLDWYGAGIDALYRTGTAGKSRVNAEELPLGWRLGWTPAGQWFVHAAPARVASGTLDTSNTYEASTYGTLLLCMPLCAGASTVASERGLAVGAGFERDAWRADLGTSPIGFPVVNAVGGIAHRGDIGTMSYTLDLSRRANPSSQLSYAGIRDPNTGRTWGGVVTNGLRVNVSRDSGGDYGAWGVAGLYRLTGRNVQSNDKGELMAGFYRRFVNEEDRQLTAGLTAMLWRFSENAGEYTFGHGGYYSPKSYRSLSLPVSYGMRTPLTSLWARAAVSVAWSESRRAPFFPTDAGLQAQAEALAPVSGIDPFYAGGSNGRSFGRSFAAAGEHQLAPGVFAGARLEIERSTNYTPNRLLLYVRFTTDGASARPVALPPEPGLPGFAY